MKRLALFALFLLLPEPLFARDFYQPINMAEVYRIMKKPGVALLDVNVPEIWEKHHLPGAVHIDSPDLARFLPTDKGATLIFYCAGPQCEASGMAANESVMLGYRRVYVMTEGIFGWVKIGFPVETAAAAKRRSVERR